MKRFGIVVLFSVAVAALGFGSFRAQAEDAKCGEKGQPSCPLQGWMEKNVGDPMDAKDLAKVAASLEKVATFAPNPKWNEGETGWAKIAKAGAAAAKAGDAAATGAACKSCHKAWRNQYKKEFRMRPVP
jgi:cytochrome c556